MGDPLSSRAAPPRSPAYRSVRDGVVADIGRAITMATGGVLAFAPAEYALTVYSYAGSSALGSKLRLAALVATLSVWLWFGLVLALLVALTAPRGLRTSFAGGAGGRGPGIGAPSPLDGGIRRGVPALWSVVVTAGVTALLVQRAAVWADRQFVEPQLTAVVVAVLALGVFALALGLHRIIRVGAEVGARALAPLLGIANPLGRWRASGAALVGVIAGALIACWFVLPQSRSVLPVRLTISSIVIAIGTGLGALVHSRGTRPRRPRSRRHALAGAAAIGALVTLTLLRWGADLETKYIAITASPALETLIKVVRATNDLDRDGFGSVLGENDCAPLDRRIHPGAADLPDDGIDENCDGRDFSLRTLAVPSGPSLPLPDAFKRGDWNILLITVDTVRYDHTTFGGYPQSAKKRDTTPRLAELVKRSTSFTFANAPSAGTMASIPAILTSKFFHSGIALDETPPPGNPPRIKPENTTLPEIMKRGGYHTGVIASHHWWNDWGMEQGVDDYDNSIGKNTDPFIVAADKVTDHVLAWITRQQTKKWFLWAHYIDPHGRYVAHPDVIDYGSSEPDLYDAELRWTDQQIGRLLDELVRLPSTDHTIIILTSDHGESMGEHNVPVGTHGTALYTELLHVPLVIYVPNNQPRQVGGAVSPLDIVPTIAEITGIDVKDLSFEGKSLVPQIFYGREESDRIVFAETNAPSPIRAAISATSKLIYYLHSNLYELYDLKADPGERTNLAPKAPPALAVMKSALDGWLERVVYARDPRFNQSNKLMAELVLPQAPTPTVATPNRTLGTGIDVLGIGLAARSPAPGPGAKIDVDVFFHVRERTPTALKLQLVTWPVDQASWKPTDPMPITAQRTVLRATGDGLFASDRWRPGEYIRDHFVMALPPEWAGTGMAVALVSAPGDPSPMILGVLPAATKP